MGQLLAAKGLGLSGGRCGSLLNASTAAGAAVGNGEGCCGEGEAGAAIGSSTCGCEGEKQLEHLLIWVPTPPLEVPTTEHMLRVTKIVL